MLPQPNSKFALKIGKLPKRKRKDRLPKHPFSGANLLAGFVSGRGVFVAGRKFGEHVLIHFLLEEEVATKNWEFLPGN